MPNWTLSWSAGSAWLCTVKYVLSRWWWWGSDWIPLDIQYFLGGGVCGCSGVFLRICLAIRCSHTFETPLYGVWRVCSHGKGSCHLMSEKMQKKTVYVCVNAPVTYLKATCSLCLWIEWPLSLLTFPKFLKVGICLICKEIMFSGLISQWQCLPVFSSCPGKAGRGTRASCRTSFCHRVVSGSSLSLPECVWVAGWLGECKFPWNML